MTADELAEVTAERDRLRASLSGSYVQQLDAMVAQRDQAIARVRALVDEFDAALSDTGTDGGYDDQARELWRRGVRVERGERDD